MAIDKRAEEAKLIAWLTDALSANHKMFSGENASDLATALAAKQTERWQKFFEGIQRTKDGNVWDNIVLSVQEAAIGAAPATVRNIAGDFVVERDIPLLTKDIDHRIVNEILNNQIIALTYTILRFGDTLPILSSPALFTPFLARSVSRIEASTTTNTPDTNSHLEQMASSIIDRQVQTYRQQLTDLDAISTQTSQEIQDLSSKASLIVEQLKKDDEARRAAWEKEKAEIINGLHREVEEFTKVASSLDLWNTKSNGHFVFFGICAAIFAVILISTPLFMIGNGVPFIADLAKNFSGDKEYLGLALLIIPTLAVAWLLRFVGRIAIQNLSLAQDARQRHAQIATYLRLLGDPKEPISPHERILALSAIFRPIAGQGIDDVNPPTVADLFKEALDKANPVKS